MYQDLEPYTEAGLELVDSKSAMVSTYGFDKRQFHKFVCIFTLGNNRVARCIEFSFNIATVNMQTDACH